MTSTWCAFFKDEKTPATYFRGLKYLSDGSLRNHVTMRVRYPHIAGGRGGGAVLHINKNSKYPPEEGEKKPQFPIYSKQGLGPRGFGGSPH